MSKETKKKGTKKPYQKPEIVYEDFSLSTNIAGNCDTIIDNSSQGACAYITVYAGATKHVFVDTVQACTTKDADGDYNGICYHVPVETTNLFNS